MPRWRVTRVIHEVAELDADDRDEAIEAIGDLEDEQLHSITCERIYTERIDDDEEESA